MPFDPNSFTMMQGVPQLPGPGTPPTPQLYGAAQPMSYQESGLTGVLNAVNKFMTSYTNSEQAKKSKATQEIERDMKLLQLGIAVDPTVMKKNFDKAGIKLDYDTYMQQMNAGIQQQNQAQGPRPGFQAQVPQAPGMAPMQTDVPPVPGQPPQPLKTEVDNSVKRYAMERMMQPILDRAQSQQRLQMLTMNNAEQAQKMLKGAMAGDRDALEQASHFDLAKLTPADQFVMAFRKAYPDAPEGEGERRYIQMLAGPSKMDAFILQYAEKMMPFFNNDLGKATQYAKDIWSTGRSDLTPGMSFEQRIQADKIATNVKAQYPYIDYGHAVVYAELATQNDPAAAKLLEMFAKTPSKGMLDAGSQMLKDVGMRLDNLMKSEEYKHLPQKHKLELMGMRDQMRRTDLIERGQNLEQSRAFERNRIDLMQMLNKNSNGQIELGYNLWAKADSEEGKRAALRMVADAVNSMPSIDIPYITGDGKVAYKTFKSPSVTAEDVGNWDPFTSNRTILRGVGDSVKSNDKAKSPASYMQEFLEKLGNAAITTQIPPVPGTPAYIPGR